MMPRLWLVTILTTTTLLLVIHTSSAGADVFPPSDWNITDESTDIDTSAEDNSSMPSNVENPKKKFDAWYFAGMEGLEAYMNNLKHEPRAPIAEQAVATSNRHRHQTTDTTTVATTDIDTTTTVPTIGTTTVDTTTTSATITTAATTAVNTTVETTTTTIATTTIATTTTTVPIVATTAVDTAATNQVVIIDESTDLVPVDSTDADRNIIFSNQESPDLDTQIATGGSDDSDAPRISPVEPTPDPPLTEIIGNRNTDDEDYSDGVESSATDSPNSHLVDHESSASSRSGNDNDDHDAPKEVPLIIPNTNDADDFVDKPYNGDVYPMTFYDQANAFMHEFGRNHGGVAFVIVCTLLAIIVMLIFLAVRECCKSRNRRRSRIPRSVTADLYNTSACSHFYQKPTLLPNQQEVTMQLVSSDIAEDMV